MREQKLIQRQLVKGMLYNFLAFTLVFSAFGAIIFSQMSNALYSKVDNDLRSTMELMQSNEAFFNKELYGKDFGPRKDDGPKDIGIGENVDTSKNSDSTENMQPPIDDAKDSFRVAKIIRDQDGNILNSGSLGQSAYDNYYSHLAFDPAQADGTIFAVAINNNQFRELSFPITVDGTDYYVQLLINVDGEQNTLSNFVQILSICVVLFVILSITISYLLSRRTMKPILEAWHRQNEFVENASHELRTPLTVIQNKQELLLTKPNEKIINESEAIAITLSEVRRLAKLTSDLLTLARAESGQTELEKESFNINEVIRNIAMPYSDIAEAEEKTVTFDMADELMIHADKARIQQLIIILLDNAIKYTPAGGSITIETAKKDSKIEISIADTGVGVSDESLKQIFNRFYREDKARSRAQGGSGLGLSIASWIVESHDGSIKAVHNQPKGTRFLIKLPK
ncbi:sensor histidine kinase [Culicoidibacter larvae]|uniref:histidine kinase n=1 Tax=Culicoidibacter larvae TaxID=2579976 RepID=A0A5R8QD06_9FIRM|nr:HAMP domain-containing sensor histidine kinase [Culicoidibacter larvae]TLG73863.1 HAMP domain-containing histidine kinase [Culicoidibacter larvae]